MGTNPDFMRDPGCSKSGHEVVFNTPHRAIYEGRNFRAEIVTKGDDLIYQFFKIKHPDFRSFLAEIVESHFGSTNAFSAAGVPELESIGVLARKVIDAPFFNYLHYTEDFLDLVDTCIGEVRQG